MELKYNNSGLHLKHPQQSTNLHLANSIGYIYKNKTEHTNHIFNIMWITMYLNIATCEEHQI